MRTLLKKIIFLLNIAFASALIVSYLSTHISPSLFVMPAFFGLAFPYLILVNILFIVFWIWRLKPEFLLSTLVIIIGFTHFQNSFKISGQGADTSGESVAVLTYNLRLFNLLEGNGGVSSEESILKLLKEDSSDIISLQEYFIAGSPEIKVAELRKLFGKGTHIHGKFIRGRENRNYGNIIISGYPMIKKGEVPLPNSASLAIFADIKVKGDTIRFYNIHLQSFRLKRMERSFLEEIYSVDQSQFYNEVTNLYRNLKRGFVRRADQSRILAAHIADSPYPVIVAGDFNDTPVSYTYSKLKENLNDSWVNSGVGLGYTYRGKYPPNRIDYILHSPEISNTGFTMIKARYSDHLPVKATFKLAD